MDVFIPPGPEIMKQIEMEKPNFVLQDPTQLLENNHHKFGNLKEIAEMDRKAQTALLRKQIQNEKSFNIKLYSTQVAISLFGGIVVAIFCYIFNPPLTQKTREDQYTMQDQDWRWVLLFSVIIALLIFIVPEFLRLIGV